MGKNIIYQKRLHFVSLVGKKKEEKYKRKTLNDHNSTQKCGRRFISAHKDMKKRGSLRLGTEKTSEGQVMYNHK